MTTTLFNQQRDLSISASSVEKVISFLFENLRIVSDEIILYFVTTKRIAHIHHLYFNDPSPTDCISFPLDPPSTPWSGPTILGEIFICPRIAIDYAKEHQIDVYEEVTRYIVHGVLHLIGYEDIRPDERSKMQAKENRYMRQLIAQSTLITPLLPIEQKRLKAL